MTLQELLTDSLRALGVLYEGEVPTASKLSNAKRAMNRLLKSIGDSYLYANTTEALSLVAGTATYTIGTGGVFNTARPARVLDDSYIVDSNGLSYPLRVISDGEYNAIAKKDVQSIPYGMVFDPQFPLANLTFYYVPDRNYTLYLVSEKYFTELSTYGAEISLPPGYEAFLVYRTAKMLSPDYPGAMSQPGFQIVLDEARAATMALQKLNAINKRGQGKLDIPGSNDGMSEEAHFLSGR
jgi:hypothetical protein